MEAHEFLTQEMIDKLQQYTDDDNGVVDDGYVEKLLDDYGKSLLFGVAGSLPKKMIKIPNAYIEDSDDVNGYYTDGRYKEVWVCETEFDKNKCINN